MIHIRNGFFVAAATCLALACDDDREVDGDPAFCIAEIDRLEPNAALGKVLDVLSNGREDDDLANVVRPECNRSMRPEVSDSEALALVHVLHADVETDSPVKLTLETPCGPTSLERSHVAGVVETTVVAPPGSSCWLVVTAKIENSELRRSARGGEGCENVDARCAAADAGTKEPTPDEDAGAD